MTKTKKMEKVEEIVDFTKPEKISESELNSLQQTVRTIDRLTGDVGRIEVQKHSLLKAMETVQATIETLRADFIKVYGTDNVNIQTGEIAYAPESQENGEVNS